MEHKFTIAYDHHANGRVERQNRTVRDTLLKLTIDCTGRMEDWDTVVPATMLTMNARVHTTLKSSPFALMFGRSPFGRTMADNIKVPSEKEVRNMEEFWKTFKTDVVGTIWKIKQTDYEKRNYRRKLGIFEVGDMVMWKIPYPKDKSVRYLGPFRVVARDVNGLYQIQSAVETFTAPANFLKKTRLSNSVKLYAKNVQSKLDENEGQYEEEHSEMGKDDLRDNTFVMEKEDSASDTE